MAAHQERWQKPFSNTLAVLVKNNPIEHHRTESVCQSVDHLENK
jgi:hypothetical protein